MLCDGYSPVETSWRWMGLWWLWWCCTRRADSSCYGLVRCFGTNGEKYQTSDGLYTARDRIVDARPMSLPLRRRRRRRRVASERLLLLLLFHSPEAAAIIAQSRVPSRTSRTSRPRHPSRSTAIAASSSSFLRPAVVVVKAARRTAPTPCRRHVTRYAATSAYRPGSFALSARPFFDQSRLNNRGSAVVSR